ncbi:OX-2 membrane glycoprotein-like isoform X1 [Silurus meridionalis]|uniref:OX-2 membrane glycoprotein-like isoform X1 n=1 Tax=Silurus meridionalis TaxID=175797 RepID=UPI001EEB93C5|nr:OX-2 membrane glycoprotein-like isoform X1 [Silurus meridionalis]
MLDYFVFLILLSLVCSARILKREDVNVSLGQDATFSCELPGAVGVKQVFWQRHGDDGTLRNMVTFTQRSKHQVDDAFVGKVQVEMASVQKTTIVIKNVTFADEACYICTFSVYPSGTERETTCLTVEGLSEITSQLVSKPQEKDATISCSATGKPAPVISWWSGEEELNNSLSETVQNEDSSETTTSNLKISQSQFSGKDVKCVAKSGSIEWSEVIIVEKQIEKETPVASRLYVMSAVAMICCIFTICVVILIYRRRSRYHDVLVSEPCV